MWGHLNAPPGNGKTAMLMTLVEESYANSQNYIFIWSVTLRVFIIDYLSEKYPSEDKSIADRIRMLTYEEGLEWWKHRRDADGHDFIYQPKISKVTADGREVDRLDWPVLTMRDPAIDLYLDEWAEAYDIDASGMMSKEHRAALRQHRKFRLNVVCACPFYNELAKPYREIGQYWIRVTNTSHETMGFGKLQVQLPRTFKWAKYRRPPTSDRDKPFVKGVFRLEPKGIHGCYNTASGSGVNNAIADQDRKRQGVHPIFMLVACVALVSVGIFFLKSAPGALTRVLMSLGSGFHKPVPVAVNNTNVQAKVPSLAGHFAVTSTNEFKPTNGARLVASPSWVEPVTINWVDQEGSSLVFGLSDGTVLDNPIGLWDGNHLMLRSGRIYFFKAAK